MSAADSPQPRPLSRGFSKLETLPEGFAEQLSRSDVDVDDIIGERYRVVRALGHGAMGKVFLAENLAIGLRVAVKLLKPELLANPDFRLRFKHEAEAVAAIRHPNVARFLDLIVGDPTFLVMEYVDGPTLHQVIAQERQLAPRRAADIATRLAWGLHAAHKAGVVHRDLKPSNILLSPDDEHGESPKIIDFGLAKVAANPGAPLTRIGQIVGTPQFMSPEQVARKEVDARSDIYALGCVLYNMLCGRAPHLDTGDDVQLLYKVVHEQVEPVRVHAPHVPAELEAVVMRALAKDPAARFQSAQELARALVPTVEKRARSMEGLRSGVRGDITEVVPKPRRFANLYSPTWWAAFVGALGLVAFAGMLWLRARAAMLLVLSEPIGAEVVLDGKPTGERTPAALTGIAPGEHEVRLRHPQYTELQRFVRLDRGARGVVDAHLLPKSHVVELQTVPTGATVYVDGALAAGRTPLSFELTDGDYHGIRIEKVGYETEMLKLAPEDGPPSSAIVLKPEKVARATLFVEANAPNEVWIDGMNSGFMTPTPGLRVWASEHVIELRDPSGAVLDEVRVHLGRGETSRIVLQSRRADRSGK